MGHRVLTTKGVVGKSRRLRLVVCDGDKTIQEIKTEDSF